MPRRNAEKHQTRTGSGTLAHIRIHGVLHRQHFRHGTAPRDIKTWLLKTELKYRGNPLATRGTFEADAHRYLETVKAMPTFGQRRQHIEEWIAVFGVRRRDTITADEIRAQLHAWRTTPRDVPQRTRQGDPPRVKTLTLSAAAVNKRRTALQHLYTVLDGRSAPNPVKDVPKFREPAPAPRAIPLAIVRAILKVMPASKSKARLMVMAFTGIPQEQIRAITPGDYSKETATVAVPGRKKGAGTPGRIVPLSPDGIKAFDLMAREEAWGPFTNTPLRQAFQRAAKAAGFDEKWTAYDLRHSFGTELYRASGDMRATQVLMGHSTPQLTHRYTLAAVDQRLTEALAKFGKRAKRSGRSSKQTKKPQRKAR